MTRLERLEHEFLTRGGASGWALAMLREAEQMIEQVAAVGHPGAKRWLAKLREEA